MIASKFLQDSRRTRLMYVVTSSLTVRFVMGQLDYLRKAGFEVMLVSSPGKELQNAVRAGVGTIAVKMAREISPLRDVVSLWRLVRMMRQLQPRIVNFSTPKAGLLGGIAALLSGVPSRVYMLRGLRCETATGLKRNVLMAAERMACACAHRVICVSESLRQKAIELGVVEANRTVVLGAGSCNGIDAQRFAPTTEALQRGKQLREKLGIPANAPVIGFVGRLTTDKGVNELVEAYCELRKEIGDLRLLVVGEMEQGDPLTERTRELLEREPGIVRTGFVDDAADYYHVLDVLAFPTYREGLPNVVLEANSAGKAVVAARATGVVDAVVDGVTGLLVPVGDAAALAAALKRVIEDRELAAALGQAGRERVVREFQRERVWEALEVEYRRQWRVTSGERPAGKQEEENGPPQKASPTKAGMKASATWQHAERRERVVREFQRERVWEALEVEYRRQWRVTSGERPAGKQEEENGPPQKASPTKAGMKASATWQHAESK